MCVMMLVGCGSNELSEKFDETLIKEEVQAIIHNLNNNNYEEVISKGDSILQKELSVNELKDVWEDVSEDLGSFVELVSVSCEEKNNIAGATVIAKYENSRAQFSMSFNEEMKLVGIYMR